MKKSLFVALFAAVMMITAPAFAGQDFDFDQDSSGNGFASVDTFAIGGGYMDSFATLPGHSGFAGGLAAGGGIADADADGFIKNGTVEVEASSTAGGLAGSAAETFNPHLGDKSIGVRSGSSAYAITGADLKIKVDPDGQLICGFIPTAGGFADGDMFGIAGEVTLNGSAVTGSPRYPWVSEGYSAGVAGQLAVGGFQGDVGALSGPDFKYWDRGPRCSCGRYHNGQWRTKDSKAGAGAGAEIEMTGSSYSASYRFLAEEDGAKLEGMGTEVGAFTTVESYGYDYDWDKGLGCSNAHLQGGFIAAGGAASKTFQTVNGGTAKATAVGVYTGKGTLGGNFYGSAEGYTRTSAMTMSGMNGSIMTSAAGMQVTSTNSAPQSNGIQVDVQ